MSTVLSMTLKDIDYEDLKMAYAEKKYIAETRKSRFVIKLIFKEGNEAYLECTNHEQMNEWHLEILKKIWSKYK